MAKVSMETRNKFLNSVCLFLLRLFVNIIYSFSRVLILVYRGVLLSSFWFLFWFIQTVWNQRDFLTRL